jgi:HD-GYP domain-containing protein (c-di-GMP phosphodiesterase class II)
MEAEVVQALVKAIELKDLSTVAHTWRVVLYTRAIAEEFGVDHESVARLTTGAALHDLGKIDLPDEILQKPGSLTPDEYDIVKTHAARGHARLRAMGETDPLILDLVKHHHERWDGKGYPDGMVGEHIALPARFFSVIDSFDAMTSLRPYRRDIGEAAAERAIVELENGRASQYWPDAVDAFARLYRTGKLNWILHHFNDAGAAPEFAHAELNTPEPFATLRGPTNG